VDAYLRSVAEMDHHSSFEDEADSFVRRPAFDVAGFERLPHEVHDFESGLARLAHLRRTAKSELDALEEESDATRRRMREALVRHGRALLGDELAGELLGG
jgi:hypothetical protein